MARIGIASPALTGHIHAMVAIGRELAGRGHDVTVLTTGERPEAMKAAAFSHTTIGAGSDRLASISARSGGVRQTVALVREMARSTRTMADGLMPHLRAGAFDALLVDQHEPGAALAALATKTPYLSVANALAINREPGVPPYFTPWLPGDTAWSRERDRGAFRVYDWIMSPVSGAIGEFAAAHGLRDIHRMEDTLSEVSVAQVCPGFDFPRRAHSVDLCGPFRNGGFGFHSPSIGAEKPIVYASFGSLFGWKFELFMTLALACKDLDLQLVIAHCGRLNGEQIAALRALAQVHAFVDQPATIGAASLIITHGGLNTVMDSICAGKPMIALPLAYDQPGTAARIVHSGIGVSLTPSRATRRSVRTAISDVLGNRGYCERSKALSEIALQSGGASRAADTVLGLL